MQAGGDAAGQQGLSAARLGVAQRLEAADLVDLALDELLAAEARVHAHDEHQVHDVDHLVGTHVTCLIRLAAMQCPFTIPYCA
jgi:hypothetical protein